MSDYTKSNEKVEMPRIKKISVVPTYVYVFTHAKAFFSLIRYLRIVIFDFFLLQFTVKWGWRKIEIINVDHVLDQYVPFSPELAPVYLDFVYFWARPLTLIIKKLKRKSLPYVVDFFKTISELYLQATSFYKYKMTTTNRPTDADYVDKNFRAIRKYDPHYLCVPSLHIAVVTLTYSFFRDVFEKENFSNEEKACYNKELYEGAVEIGETVLYVKQHSVNCIPAAVYMMTNVVPQLFSIDDAVTFLDSLFANQSNIDSLAKKEINEHLHLLFEQLLLEGAYETHWLEPLKRWLYKYQNGVYAASTMKV